MPEIPIQWLRLAGELLSEVQGMDHDEHLECPDDWHPLDYLEFKDTVHTWLNEELPESERYTTFSPLLNWQAMDFLGAVLREIEEQPVDEFASHVLVVNPS